jgi:hypothetical protein
MNRGQAFPGLWAEYYVGIWEMWDIPVVMSCERVIVVIGSPKFELFSKRWSCVMSCQNAFGWSIMLVMEAIVHVISCQNRFVPAFALMSYTQFDVFSQKIGVM